MTQTHEILCLITLFFHGSSIKHALALTQSIPSLLKRHREAFRPRAVFPFICFYLRKPISAQQVGTQEQREWPQCPFCYRVMLWIKINTFTYPFETIWAWVLRYKSLLSWPITTRVIDYSSKASVKWSAKGKCRNPSFAYQTWQVEGFTTVTVTVT